MPQRKNKNWKESEIKFLKENYKKMKVNKLAEKIDRTPRGVRAKLERLNLNLKPLKRNKKYKWTEKDINFLKNNYNDLTDKEMAKHIGKSKSAVCRKRLKLC